MRTLLGALGPASVASAAVLSSLLALAAAGAPATLGCVPLDDDGGDGGTSSGSTGDSGASGADGGLTAAGKACLDTATAYATAAKRCGGDYDAERAAFIRDLAAGDCNSVSIRNETELRALCIPSFSRISCSDLKEQRFVPGCAGQIIR